jgi:LAO/AO transport system kinase
MATRGHLGGLSLATPQAIRILDAAGKPFVLVETVGVGQVEVEVAGAADTTIVVVNPGWGDAVQANKAGLLEIADLFVVNKADRDGTAETVRDLDAMLDLSGALEWRPRIVQAVATTGRGVDDVWDGVAEHRAFLEENDRLKVRRDARLRDELHSIVRARLEQRVAGHATGERFEKLVGQVSRRELDPYAAADELLGG